VSWLSENPWPLAGACAVLAVACLVLLKATQQGKYLLRAGVLAALALLVVVVERAWVTDAERIEAVVYDLAAAVRRSDADATLALLTPDVSLIQTSVTLGGRRQTAAGKAVRDRLAGGGEANPARVVIGNAVRDAKFDFLSLSRLDARAYPMSGRGRADLRIFAAGSVVGPGGVQFNFATDGSGTDWSLGLRQEGGRWAIDQITATRVPRSWQLPVLGGSGGGG
jgi:hypothetical protein